MALAAVACDRFFSLAGVVTRCDDKSPLADVEVKAVLDRGAGEEDLTLLSDQEGRFQVVMNEPSDAWVTVTLSKPGFKPTSHQFRGSDGDTAKACLAASDSTESSAFE
jgi:hypothetical protein